MTKKEEFIIKIMLQKMELTESESISLLNAFKEYGLTYDRIIKRKMHIYPLVQYFKRKNYSNNHINDMITIAVAKFSCKKIMNINDVLINNDYSKLEIQRIEKYKEIFRQNKDTLHNKIEYFNDYKLMSLTVINPKSLIISLKLSHARIELFKRKNISLKNDNKKLFESDDRFKYDFGITTDELERIYPLPDKYLIKK